MWMSAPSVTGIGAAVAANKLPARNFSGDIEKTAFSTSISRKKLSQSRMMGCPFQTTQLYTANI